MQMIIGIGCTGGQHRSVTLTNYFAQYYSKYYQDITNNSRYLKFMESISNKMGMINNYNVEDDE